MRGLRDRGGAFVNGEGAGRLRIYHTSDLHDHRGIVPRLRELRAREPGLLFDCGDSLRGSQTVYRGREPIIGEIDEAGYDAQGIGNREFHYLFGLLAARARKMRHPLVCSNLIDVRGRPLPFVRDLTIEREGWKLRVFSLLVVQYPEGSPWEKLFGWRFLDPLATAARYAETTPAGTTLVVLSHLGLRMDRKLALAVPRLDLILGGHSHDTLPAPEVVGGVPIVHAGPYGAFASRTELEREPAGGRARIARFDLVPLLAAPVHA
jgi:2',3'-cyclic-nucleotide 2'-phosphodiesterase (5'-nucleotidase family)